MAKRSNKIKRPKAVGGKRIVAPTAKDEIPAEQQPPIFSLEYLQPDYCVSRCQKHEQAALACTLQNLSQLNWKELRLAPRHGLGYEIIDRNIMRCPIPGHITDDTDLKSFRFCGKKAMIGYRTGRIFHIVWLDRNFSVYNHGS